MKADEYLAQLAEIKDQKSLGDLIGKAISDKECTPDAYTALCNIAKDKGFKFVNIQLP